jgi:hypothetical protein
VPQEPSDLTEKAWLGRVRETGTAKPCTMLALVMWRSTTTGDPTKRTPVANGAPHKRRLAVQSWQRHVRLPPFANLVQMGRVFGPEPQTGSLCRYGELNN